MKSLLCLILAHDLEPVETLSPYTTKMFCRRCENYFALRIEGEVELVVRWTEGMETSLQIRHRVEQQLNFMACKGAR